MVESEKTDFLSEGKAIIAQIYKKRANVNVILAYIDSKNPVDFLLKNIVAAWVSKHYPAGKMAIAFEEGSRSFSFIADCNKYANKQIKKDGDFAFLPIDWFDLGIHAPVKCENEEWARNGYSTPDLLLVPSMLDGDPSALDGIAQAPPTFFVPYHHANSVVPGMVANGLEPGRWICTVGLSGDDAAGREIVAKVRACGGQCVVQGPWSGDADGVLALPVAEDAPVAWASAISLSRFVVARDPFVAALAGALRVPAVIGGMADAGRLAWTPTTVVRSIDDVSGLLDEALQWQTDWIGWRTPAADMPLADPGSLRFPLWR